METDRLPWSLQWPEFIIAIFVAVLFGLAAILMTNQSLESAYPYRVSDLQALKETPFPVALLSFISALALIRFLRKTEIRYISRRANLAMGIVLVGLSPWTYLPPLGCGTILALPIAIVIALSAPTNAKEWDWVAIPYTLAVTSYCAMILIHSVLRVTD